MKKKILFVTDQFMTGGVETVFLNISNLLTENIDLLPLHSNYNQTLLRKLPNNVKFKNKYQVSRGIKGLIMLFFNIIRVKRNLINNNTRVINFSDTLTTLFFCYLVNPSNFFSWIHCNPKALRNSKNSKLYFWLLSKCKKIIFISESQRALFFSMKESKKINIDNTEVCTNFFNESFIEENLKEKIIFNKNSFFFTAARLDLRSKDYATLLKGYSFLSEKLKKQYSLIIAGDGPDRDKIEKIIQKEKLDKNVFLIGNQDNVYKFMNKAKLYIHSSISEGFSMAILEALACNATVVASDCEVGPSEILGSGKYGYLYKTGDPYDLALKIQEALRTPIKNESARKRALVVNKKGKEELRRFIDEE